MFVDASAIIAIIAAEDDAVSLAGRLSRSRDRYTSAVAIFEAAAGLARIGNVEPQAALDLVDRFPPRPIYRSRPLTGRLPMVRSRLSPVSTRGAIRLPST
jgi:predicted nucleic acid-binding protein